MKNRKTATFVYKGLGLPIKLINVPMKKMLGEWVLDIDFNKLQVAVLHCLLYKSAPLNGGEVRYIRKFLDLSMADFGKVFGITHVAVLKWENGKNQIPLPTDVYIRLYTLNFLHAKDREFRHLYNTINPEALSKHKGERGDPISINVAEDLKSA